MFFILSFRGISLIGNFFLILGMVGGISQGVWGRGKILTAKEKKCDLNQNFFNIIAIINEKGGVNDFKECPWGKNASLALWSKIEGTHSPTIVNDFCKIWKTSTNLKNFFKGNGRIKLKCGHFTSSDSLSVGKEAAPRRQGG